MEFKTYRGMKVKVSTIDSKGNVASIKYGKVVMTTLNLIVVQFEHYKETFSREIIIADRGIKIEIRDGGSWIELRKHMAIYG